MSAATGSAMMTPVGATARWVAAARALETECSQPLFADPMARSLAGDLGFQLLAQLNPDAGGTQGRPPQPDLFLSIRTRYLDDALTTVVAERGLLQVVLLAAGMDTRAFRLSWPAGTVIYEIDRDDVFEWKEAVLEARRAVPGCERHVVRADLAGAWIPALVAAGFDPARPTAFLAEGLVMYLDQEAVNGLMAGVASIAAEGSWMGIDAANPELLASRLTAGYMARLRSLGVPFQSAMADPELDFATHGWHATVITPGHPTAHYGRWPGAAIPSDVSGIPRALFVTANRGSAFAPPAPAPVSTRTAAHHAWGAGCNAWDLLQQEMLGVVEKQMPSGAVGECRRHGRSRQFFYVLAGELSIEVEHNSHVMGAGSGIEVPPVVAHRIWNAGPHPVRFLAITLRNSAWKEQ